MLIFKLYFWMYVSTSKMLNLHAFNKLLLHTFVSTMKQIILLNKCTIYEKRESQLQLSQICAIVFSLEPKLHFLRDREILYPT